MSKFQKVSSDLIDYIIFLLLDDSKEFVIHKSSTWDGLCFGDFKIIRDGKKFFLRIDNQQMTLEFSLFDRLRIRGPFSIRMNKLIKKIVEQHA